MLKFYNIYKMKKEYQDVSVQKLNLIENKKVSTESIINDVFNEKTYLNLINPYSDLIAIGRDSNGKHIYSDNDFKNYIECNILDHTISLKLHLFIGCFEKRLRCYIMHSYCKKMKTSGDRQTKNSSWLKNYLENKSIFDLIRLKQKFDNGNLVAANEIIISRRKKAIQKLIDTMDIETTNKNSMVLHYKNKYGYIPFFVAIHNLSLGDLVCLFGMLPKSEKVQFINDLNRIGNKVLADACITKFEKKLKRINDIRNIINHYEPIFPLILGTDWPSFSALIDIFSLLKNNFDKTYLKVNCAITINQLSIPWNTYSHNNHRKIEAVVNCLK